MAYHFLNIIFSRIFFVIFPDFQPPYHVQETNQVIRTPKISSRSGRGWRQSRAIALSTKRLHEGLANDTSASVNQEREIVTLISMIYS